MNSLAQALRRIADRIDPPKRGIPVADRGDALDFDWDETHGENPL
jgi:hypothetical protein